MCLAKATSTTDLLPSLLSKYIRLLDDEIEYEPGKEEKQGVTNNEKCVTQKGTPETGDVLI